MKMKSIAASLLGSALLATTALAQTTTAPSTTTAPAATTTTSDASSSSYTGNWRSSKIVGLNVYNDSNESLGSINDLLTDKSGKIVAVIVGVGGFLGVGERNVAIPFEKVKFSTEPVKSNTASSGGAMPGGSASTTTTTTTTGAAGGAAGSAMSTPAAAKPNPWYPDHAVISATKDELKSMPEFKFST